MSLHPICVGFQFISGKYTFAAALVVLAGCSSGGERTLERTSPSSVENGAGGAGGAASKADAGGSILECIPEGSACDNNMFQFRQIGYIADFESGEVTVPGGGTWFTWSSDATATSVSGTEPLLVEEGAHTGSTKSAKYEWESFDPDSTAKAGMGLLWINCFDVSATDAFSFYARADRPTVVDVNVHLPSTQSTNYGGDCVERCPTHPSTSVNVTTEWQKFSVPWSDFEPPGRLLDCNLIVSATWQIAHPAPESSATFWLDDVGLE